ncbi:MAG: HNH endonuclease [Dehalococcoidia bacterium]|nr:HNH endonuclease [Dehalococcoidia bacterium]
MAWPKESRQANRGRPWRRTVAKVIARDRGVCHLCSQPGADTADHVVPRARGGSDDEANLKAAHQSCNQRKARTTDQVRLSRRRPAERHPGEV